MGHILMKSRRFPRHFRTQAATPAGIGNFSAKSGSLRELGRSDRERVHDAQAVEVLIVLQVFGQQETTISKPGGPHDQ